MNTPVDSNTTSASLQGKFSICFSEEIGIFMPSTTIEFPSPKDEKKIFLVGGMNGAGKTSLMEAINICLYGAKVDFIYKYINRKELAKDNAYVSVELSFLNDEDEEMDYRNDVQRNRYPYFQPAITRLQSVYDERIPS